MAEGISVLWAVWRARNRLVFDGGSDGVEWGIQLAVSMRNDMWSCWGRAAKDGVGGQNGLSNQFVSGSCNQGVQGWIPKFLVDGARCKQSLRGAAAWVSLSALSFVQEKNVRSAFASSALMVEAVAVLDALRWALGIRFRRVEVLTDCLVLVQSLWCMEHAESLRCMERPESLRCMERADVFVKPVLRDMLGLMFLLVD
ncbi:hypothetical protein RHGRI_014729 [Rhododendron griersonianum]|uniref:RNase H type-1 domain-containing protein n=1 Tax=Rhododendron griersonianum TaxID=479676 RepID=A0AAV6KAQ9_9ERIC|nr:hypothetical protein RHGRI_014729 [Rhododendron griersonianum]